MGKHKIAHAVSAVALIAGSGLFVPAVFADEGFRVLDSCEGIESCAVVTDTAELSDAFTSHKSTILMGGSFDLTADLRTDADMDFYLNNYTLTSDGYSIINTNGNLTIYAGESGKIVETGGVYAPLYVYNNTVLKSGVIEAAGQAVFVYYDTGIFTMDGGTINGGSDVATTVVVSNGAKFAMNGGSITGDTWGVSVFKDAEFEMNGGVINVTADGSIGVSGNGSASGQNEGTNAKLTLNAGTINSADLGVYAPQVNGETTLGNGLTINAEKCGIEIRAGSLTVDGATINVNENTTYAFDPNGNGSTATGVGIAVAQHTTKQPINVVINSGTITAPVAFAEANPQENSDEDIAKISLSITGGNFQGDVVSEDFNKDDFVTGGSFGKVASAEEGNINMEVDGAVVAESQTTLTTSEVDLSTLSLKSDEPEAEVVLARDFALVDGNGNAVSIESGDGVSLTIHVALSGEEYEALSGYDKVQAIYFDDNGEEVERIDATLQQREDGMWEVVFTTDHLSTYAIAGVNNTEDEETSGDAAATDAAAAPETGTMTAAGASATGAAMVTAVAVGILTSVVSFVYLMRRR